MWLSPEGGNYDYPDGTGVQVNAFLRVSAAAAGGEQRTVVIQNKIRNDLDVQVGGGALTVMVSGKQTAAGFLALTSFLGRLPLWFLCPAGDFLKRCLDRRRSSALYCYVGFGIDHLSLDASSVLRVGVGCLSSFSHLRALAIH